MYRNLREIAYDVVTDKDRSRYIWYYAKENNIPDEVVLRTLQEVEDNYMREKWSWF